MPKLLAATLIMALASAFTGADLPPMTGRVVDNASILSNETRTRLEALLAAHEDETTNQIAVLTIRSLQGESVEQYSMRVASRWQLGTRERDNGVLFVVAHGDREMRIEVGYGLEGDLPDIVAGRIIRNVVIPHFRNDDFNAGIEEGVISIIGALQGTYTPPERSNPEGPEQLWARLFFAAMFLAIPGLFAVFGVVGTGCFRWFTFFFVMPFIFIAGAAMFDHFLGGVAIWLFYLVAFIGGAVYVDRDPRWKERREKIRKGETVKVGFLTIGPVSGSTGGFSSGGSSFSGGGFSGGGGSFGGGGASGRW